MVFYFHLIPFWDYFTNLSRIFRHRKSDSTVNTQKRKVMWDFIKSSFKLVKNVKSTGAFSQTSKQVVEAISANVDPTKPQIIVEFGVGPGNITKGILKKMHPESRLIGFEIEVDFLSDLRKIDDPRFTLVNDSAELIDDYLMADYADVIISSLPLTILPKNIFESIMEGIVRNMNKDSVYCQILYSNKVKKFQEYFPRVETVKAFNVPMATIHRCRL